MRVVKSKMLEMIPDLRVFLDVDDLEEGRGAEYVDVSKVVLVFVSEGYFVSPNCMREFLRAVFDEKPILTLMEPETKKGGMTRQQVLDKLQEAESMYFAKWGLSDEMEEWGFLQPSSVLLYDKLFNGKEEPIEWNRIGFFQDVTLRLIANRILPRSLGKTYVQGELVSCKALPMQPPAGTHHIYVSTNNPGAFQVLAEVTSKRSISLISVGEQGQEQGGTLLDAAAQLTSSTVNAAVATTDAALQTTAKLVGLGTLGRPRRNNSKAPPLRVISRLEDLPHCDHMLVYLTSRTWTSPKFSTAFAQEVERAMDEEVHLLLLHEMPGMGGQELRFGTDFGNFFSSPDGTTPLELIKRGIYQEIALPLKGGAWREASISLVHQRLTSSTGDSSMDGLGSDALWGELQKRFSRHSSRFSSRLARKGRVSFGHSFGVGKKEKAAEAAITKPGGNAAPAYVQVAAVPAPSAATSAPVAANMPSQSASENAECTASPALGSSHSVEADVEAARSEMAEDYERRLESVANTAAVEEVSAQFGIAGPTEDWNDLSDSDERDILHI